MAAGGRKDRQRAALVRVEGVAVTQDTRERAGYVGKWATRKGSGSVKGPNQ